jgi:hypothetical protein
MKSSPLMLLLCGAVVCSAGTIAAYVLADRNAEPLPAWDAEASPHRAPTNPYRAVEGTTAPPNHSDRRSPERRATAYSDAAILPPQSVASPAGPVETTRPAFVGTPSTEPPAQKTARFFAWDGGNPSVKFSTPAAHNSTSSAPRTLQSIGKAQRESKAASPSRVATDAGVSTEDPHDSPRSQQAPSVADQAPDPSIAHELAIPTPPGSADPRRKFQWPRGNLSVEEERERAQYGWQAFADRVFQQATGEAPVRE